MLYSMMTNQKFISVSTENTNILGAVFDVRPAVKLKQR